MDEIDAEKLKRMLQLHVNFILLDLRSAAQYQDRHLRGAFHVEPSSLKEYLKKSVPNPHTPIVIYDEDGANLSKLLNEAEGLGYINVVGVTGGFQATIQAGVPLA